jgi:hypothetical protein
MLSLEHRTYSTQCWTGFRHINTNFKKNSQHPNTYGITHGCAEAYKKLFKNWISD